MRLRRARKTGLGSRQGELCRWDIRKASPEDPAQSSDAAKPPKLPLWLDEPELPGRRRLLLLRALLGAASLVLKFYALRSMSLADASVILLSVPVFVAVSALF